MNERTSFASWASAFESSELVIGLKLINVLTKFSAPKILCHVISWQSQSELCAKNVTNSTNKFYSELFPISEKTDEFSVRRDVEKKNLLKHVRFESLNGLPQSWGQFASLEFFIKKCRHDINKLKVNRNTKLSNHSSEDWSALKSLKKRRNIY